MLVCQPGQVALPSAGGRAGLQPHEAGPPPPACPGPRSPDSRVCDAGLRPPGPRLPPLAGSSPAPCTLLGLGEWAAELLPSAPSVAASGHCHHTRTALNRGTKG